MRPPRYSIAGLTAFIVFVAVGLAALSRPSYLSASAMFSLLVMSLTVAVLGVLYRTGRRRAFWTGFLACGLFYTVLSLAPWFNNHVGTRLVTTALLDVLYPRMPLLEDASAYPNDPWKKWTGSPSDYPLRHARGFTMSTVGTSAGPKAVLWVNTTDEFLLIGHSLFGMLIAAAGGVLARSFHEPRS